MTIEWSAGPDHGLVWSAGVAIVDGGLHLDAVREMWGRLEKVAELPRFLELLSETAQVSLLALPQFAVVLLQDGRAHAAARGHFAVQLDHEVISGEGVSTWSERLTVAPQRLALGSGFEADAVWLPISGGMVPCCGLSLSLSTNPSTAEPVPAVAASESPSSATDAFDRQDPAAVEPAVIAEQPSEPEEHPEQPQAQPQDEPTPVISDLSATAHEDLADYVAAQPNGDVADGERAGVEAINENAGQFDHLWGMTNIRPVEEAAVRSPAESDDAQDVFISGVPADLKAAESQPDPPDGDDEWGVDDHDFHTVVGAGLADLMTPPEQEPALIDPASTLAVLCGNQHANPPHRAECWRCGDRLGATPQRVSRPVVALVRASTGELLEVNKDVVVGRNPRSRIHGNELPRLLALPYGHISATHLQLKVEKWTVLAIDQNSTNGTYLRRHANTSRLPDSPIPLAAGDMLDFGHGVNLTIEAVT